MQFVHGIGIIYNSYAFDTEGSVVGCFRKLVSTLSPELKSTLRPLSRRREGAACTGRLGPKRVTFFRHQVYERVEVSLAEVYERGGKSVTSEVQQG